MTLARPLGPRVLAIIAVVAGALILWLGLATPRPVEAAWLLFELVAGRVPRILPASLIWRADGISYAGDLYGEPNESEAALLLVPGAAATGKDDPRLIRFARGLADHGFLVLVPDLPGPKALRVGSEDVTGIVQSAVHLATLQHGRGPLGIAAISYAVGPAVLATLDPALRGKVNFLVGIGGYYDATDIITFFTTGYWREGPNQPWQKGQPNAYGKWVFVLANAPRLDDFADRERLGTIARAKLRNLDADIRPLETALGPEGRAVMALLDNRDPARVPDLIATLPPRVQNEIAALDLAGKDLSSLGAEAILIHGRDDRIIPYTESVALARAIGPDAHLFLLDHLTHASLAAGTEADLVSFWEAILELLRIRDRGLAPG